METQYVPTRKYIDLSSLTMDNQALPFVYVDSRIMWENKDSGFAPIVQRLKESPKPGFFLTPQKEGDGYARVRLSLNRHCVLASEPFRDSSSILYRDVDAKGVGYARGYPIRVFPIQESEMSGDMELRGILHGNVALEDRINTEELYKCGVRVARHAAHIELLELLDREGNIVPRSKIGEEFWTNMDVVRPTIAVRAQGTTSRVWDVRVTPEINNHSYVREMLEDARSLVSYETSCDMQPRDYAAWFYGTLGKQIALVHKNGMRTDFAMQIHAGMHNVTLDCRFLDTQHYYTRIMQHKHKHERKAWEKANEKKLRIGAEHSKETMQGWKNVDAMYSRDFVLKELSRAVQDIYGLQGVHEEMWPLFLDAYKRNI